MPDLDANLNLDGVGLRLELAVVGARLDAAADRALQLAGEHLLQVSNERVPIEYGDLERSGKVSVGEGVVAVSYSTPYAVPQHEELDWQHNDGRQAKFLESAAYDEQLAIRLILQAELGGAL